MRDGLFLHREHIVIEFGTSHEAITPVEIELAGLWILEYVHIDSLSATCLLGTVGIGDDRSTTVHKRTGGTVAHGNTNLLAVALGVMGREIEEILVSLSYLFLNDAGSPCITCGPFHLITLHVEHLAFVLPVHEVLGREDTEVVATPAGCTVGSAIDIVFLGLVGIEHLGVGMETREDRLLVVRESLEQALLLSTGNRDDSAVTRCELTAHLGVLHKLEGLQVFRLTELIVTVAVAVVHDNP